ncbi:MAG TPA: hypothetical protein VMN03_08755 [Burkholderiales bacterium]|nr:hypothetical protein [Burkholderiales bacterium]
MSESTDVRYIIDRELVAAEIARSRDTLARGKWRWFRRSFTYVAAPVYLVTIALQWDRMSAWAAQPPATQLALLLLPGLFAAGATWWSMRVLFNRRTLDVDAQVREIAESLRSVAGHGWMKRALRIGLALSAGIGIPVGAMMMVLWTPEDLPVANRWLTIPVFVAITMLWAMPAAFLFRWLSLVALRRFVKAVPSNDPDGQRTSA